MSRMAGGNDPSDSDIEYVLTKAWPTRAERTERQAFPQPSGFSCQRAGERLLSRRVAPATVELLCIESFSLGWVASA